MHMILKTLFDLLEGVRTWKLLKGGVEKAKVRKVKKGRRPYCPFVNAEKDLRRSGICVRDDNKGGIRVLGLNDATSICRLVLCLSNRKRGGKS